MNKLNWAILATGWGLNAKDTIENFSKGKLKNSKLSLLVYEQEICGAADKANETGVEAIRLIKNDFDNMISYQQELTKILKDRNIDYLFLLGYKYIIKPKMLAEFPNKIVNIHPSLFPSFLATKTAIHDAIDYGVKVSGITTHIIDDKIDEGIILCQTPVRIKKHDTFDSLYPKFSKKSRKVILKTIREIENLEKQNPKL